MRFPDAVGDFQRSQIFRYDAKGLDVSAGYNLASTAGFMVATVYIYPAPSLVSIGSPPDVVASARETLCRNEFEHRKREVFNAHPGARLIREEGIAPPHPGTSTAGRRAVFEYDASFAGGQQPIHSELWIFCYIGGKWALEYRFSSPLSVDAGPVISAFMATLPWPISP